MSKRSRRTVRSALGFDALEERRLLSNFAGPGSPGWDRSVGHREAPPAMLAMLSDQPHGPFGGPPSSWAQNQRLQWGGPPPSAA